MQGEDESIANYVETLCRIAEQCEYGKVPDDMLCDCLVCGTRIQYYLLQESALTFKEAMKVV